MTIEEIIRELETVAPLQYQEDYDNCGLLAGQKHLEASGALLSLDCTEDVVEEAITLNCNLIIAHHPILFKGLKKITGSNYVERTLIKAIQNNIAIYAIHTNLDNVKTGVNQKIADKLGLVNTRILVPKNGILKKLVTFVPVSHLEKVQTALFAAGAGRLGNYDECGFTSSGTGTFRGNEASKPFIGKPNERSVEVEIRLETIFERHLENHILSALIAAHPYEEVAYELYDLRNVHPNIGSGMTGELPVALSEMEFLALVKKTFLLGPVKHSHFTGKMIKKVALCGGGGSFLLKNAIGSGSEAFITSDVKYHEYFDVEKKLLLVDTGHYESEQFSPEIFYDIIQKKFTTFAIHLSKTNTNPINYL